MKKLVCAAAVAMAAVAAVAAAPKLNLYKSSGVVKPVNGVGQPPMRGLPANAPMFHYLKEAGIPYSRLHDVGSWMGQGLWVDVPNIFRDFDADENDEKNYSFVMTDALITHLVKHDVEPFFRLGVTIENFAGQGFPAIRAKPPKDYAKWARICEHIIRHYTEGWANGFRYKITYWEIWNEPENHPESDKNPMWQGEWQTYLDFYGTVAPYLKSKFPHLKIGGYGHCGFYAGVNATFVAAANSSPRMSYFIDCSHKFLKLAKERNWPLDFFSYHSYSLPKEALRQVDFADGILNQYGFTADKTERIFNEWLPCVGQKWNGTIHQAANVAAELIGLQNGPCDVACIYDARCGLGNYSPLFDPSTFKPRKAYYAFLAFNELRKLKNAVAIPGGLPENVYVAAATDTKNEAAVMIANVSGQSWKCNLNFGNWVVVSAKVLDETTTYEDAEFSGEVGNDSVWLLKLAVNPPAKPVDPAIAAKRQAFADQRFGVFLHWGLYANYAQGEWYLQVGQLDEKAYSRMQYGFCPSKFNAREWVKTIKGAGAKYITITSRHHDGFSLWPTKADDGYNIANTPFKRDILGELAEACKAEGIQLNFYYSLIDWHRTDYPFGRRGNIPCGRNPGEGDYPKYKKFMMNQLTELLDRYHPGCIWFDGEWDQAKHRANGSWERTLDWGFDEIYDLVHRKGALVANNNHQPCRDKEDVQLFERDLPGDNGDFGACKYLKIDTSRPIEQCDVIQSKVWGYRIGEKNFRTPEEVVAMTVRCAGRDSNMLMNIGPDGSGQLPARAVEVMAKVGEWFRKNGESVYATKGGYAALGKDVVTTVKGDFVYVHFINPELTSFTFRPKGDIVSAKYLATGEDAIIDKTPSGDAIVSIVRPRGNQFDIVVRLEVKKAPFPKFAKARAVTGGEHDHFLANYFGINAWSPDNRYLLTLETDIKDKMPDGKPCTLGLVDLRDGNRFIPVTTTRCWNFQEAAMAHWLPWAKDTFVFNDVRDGKFSAVIMNWRTREERVIPGMPVSAVSEDGEWAVSINYARLFLTRPDYGYAGDGQDAQKNVVFPENDGLWRVNLRTGEAKLIVSVAAVKDMVPAVGPKGMSYLCHTVISKDFKRIYFLSRSVEESMEGVKKFKGVNWFTTAFTCNADGSNVRRCFPDNWGSSHFNWKPNLSPRDAATMVVTCNWRDQVYTHVEFTVGEESKAHRVGGRVMDFDGHCIYTPDGKFVSGDGYFGSDGMRHWKIVRLADSEVRDLGDWFVPEVYRDIYCRCDLHPRWRPDGRQIGFNSVHEGTRQVYVMDVEK